jgi:hypothetical protein
MCKNNKAFLPDGGRDAFLVNSYYTTTRKGEGTVLYNLAKRNLNLNSFKNL